MRGAGARDGPANRCCRQSLLDCCSYLIHDDTPGKGKFCVNLCTDCSTLLPHSPAILRAMGACPTGQVLNNCNLLPTESPPMNDTTGNPRRRKSRKGLI